MLPFFSCCSCHMVFNDCTKFNGFFIMRLLKTRRQWTVRDFFYWFLSCAGGNYSLNGVYLMMELKEGEKKRESRVYKVISRRIIKHHEMILECFLWWCLSSSSSLIFSVPPPSSVGIFIHGIKASRVSSCCIMTFVNLELWMVSSRSRWTTVLASSWDVALIASSSSANDNRAENYIWIKSKISVNEGLLSQDHVLLCGGSRIVQIFLLKYSPLLMLLKCRWASHNFFFLSLLLLLDGWFSCLLLARKKIRIEIGLCRCTTRHTKGRARKMQAFVKREKMKIYRIKESLWGLSKPFQK